MGWILFMEWNALLHLNNVMSNVIVGPTHFIAIMKNPR